MDPDAVIQLLTPSQPLLRLTRREREVLSLMAQGFGNAEIGDRLVVTTNAVHKHIGSIYSKLGLPPAEGGHRRVLAVLAYLEGMT